MQASGALKIAGVAAVLVAEVAIIVALSAAADGLPVDGVMVGQGDAIIEVHDQRILSAMSIDRIVTPVDGWVILRVDRDGVPAELIGAAQVSKGESRYVGVVLDRRQGIPDAVFVSLLTDQGKIGEFEFSTGDPRDSVSLGGGGMSMGDAGPSLPEMDEPADKLLIAGGEVVTAHAQITPFDIVYHPAEANIGAAYLSASGNSASVQRIDAPGSAWVAIVRGIVDGKPPEIIGAALVGPGHTDVVEVELSEVPETANVTAILLADLGATGVLETDPAAPSRGVDAPYLVLSYYVQIPVYPGR